MNDLRKLAVITGVALLAHHKLNYGKFWDEDQELCHGKVGGVMILAALFDQ